MIFVIEARQREKREGSFFQNFAAIKSDMRDGWVVGRLAVSGRRLGVGSFGTCREERQGFRIIHLRLVCSGEVHENMT